MASLDNMALQNMLGTLRLRDCVGGMMSEFAVYRYQSNLRLVLRVFSGVSLYRSFRKTL